jgi:ribosomal protein S18 acetylase RimI-like enzyme
VVRQPGGFALVHEGDEAAIIGFIAGATDVGALYKSFLLRDGVVAAAGAVAPLARSWRRALETLRYPASTTTELPDAEILAVAVDAPATGRGIGRALVDAAGLQFLSRGATSVKVVAGADNVAAVRLYEACGYQVVEQIEVHDGTRSVVLVRQAANAETVA